MSPSILDTQLAKITGKNAKGDLGIELEIEGTIATLPESTRFWSCKPENSLRNGVEFVLARPVTLKDLPAALQELENTLSKSKPKSSLRCSTHIHVNVLDKTIREIYNILAYYFLVEDLLVKTQGPLRIGNLFCLRMSDAEGVSQMLDRSIISQDYLSHFTMNTSKYGAVNLATPTKFGSLEFRFFRPVLDMKILDMWSRALHTMCDRMAKVSIEKTCSSLLTMSPENFLLLGFNNTAFVDYVREDMHPIDINEHLGRNFDYVSRMGRLIGRKKMLEIPSRYLETDLEDGYNPMFNTLGKMPPPPVAQWHLTEGDEGDYSDD